MAGLFTEQLCKKHHAFNLNHDLQPHVLCRNAEKVGQVLQDAKAAGEGGTMSSYTYDLSGFASIKQFASHVKAEHSTIDFLVNNAGIFSEQKAVSDDGIELTWAVNALAPFLLTALLLDTVKERIVNVGSMALAHAMDFDNLQQVHTA